MQRLRQFTRIHINGREALRWAPYSSPYGSQRSLHLAPIQHALRQYYGDDVKLPDSYPAEDEPASALIDDVYPPVQALQIEAQVKEVLYRWQVVADLPLSAGASAVHGESRWTITHATTFPDSSGGSRKSVAIQEHFPTIWLGQAVGERGEPAIRDQFALLDPSTGRMLSGSAFDHANHSLHPRTDARRSLGERFISLFLGEDTWWDGKTPEIDWSREHRLVILRAVVVDTLYYDWRSAGPVLYPSKWLSLPYIDSLKSVRSIDPPLVTASDAAAVTRNGLGWLTDDLLFQDPDAKVLTEDEWIAFFRLDPSAKRYHQLADGFVPRPDLAREADAWLAGYKVRPPNPHIDPMLALALARGHVDAPRWFQEAITRKRTEEPTFHPAWVDDPVRESFVLPPGLKTEAEIVDWLLAQDSARFVFDPAPGKFQLR